MVRRATVVGSGPNGLAAAVALARAGYAVQVVEGADAVGGGVRTAELTLPGFRHDVCSAVHPAALSSAFFRAFGLDRIDWIVPEASFAHPLPHGHAAIAWRSLDRTVDELGADGPVWRRLVRPLNRRLSAVAAFTGDQLLRVPAHPATTVRFGLRTLWQGSALSRTTFRTEAGAALWAGVAAHANSRMPAVAAAASALYLLAHAHSTGWAYPRGGADAIATALCDDLQAHGGVVTTGTPVTDLSRLDWGDPAAGDLLLLDTAPRLALTLPDVPFRYARAVARYRYGPAASKVDVALDGPVPWQNGDVAASPTVHVGGTAAEIAAAENAVHAGRVPERPYVLVVQPGVLDPTRAPAGAQTLWAYIHVPLRSRLDATELVIRQIERFAPGFRDRVLASHATPATATETANFAHVGGDVLGGSFTLTQAVRRPVFSRTPWRTPMRGVYLASASTPPGPGVHGLAGWNAARQALHDAGTPATLHDLFG